MTRSTWKVINWGKVPRDARPMEFSCPHCDHEAQLPMLGVPLAQLEGGIVFDTWPPYAMPNEIQCRRCRHRFEFNFASTRDEMNRG